MTFWIKKFHLPISEACAIFGVTSSRLGSSLSDTCCSLLLVFSAGSFSDDVDVCFGDGTLGITGISFSSASGEVESEKKPKIYRFCNKLYKHEIILIGYKLEIYHLTRFWKSLAASF